MNEVSTFIGPLSIWLIRASRNILSNGKIGESTTDPP